MKTSEMRASRHVSPMWSRVDGDPRRSILMWTLLAAASLSSVTVTKRLYARRRKKLTGSGSDSGSASAVSSIVLHTSDEVECVVQACSGLRCEVAGLAASIPVIGRMRSAADAADATSSERVAFSKGLVGGPLPELNVNHASYARAAKIVSRDPELLPSLEAYALGLDYCTGVLSKESPHAGRKGPVCPFVPKAMRNRSIYISVVGTASGCDAFQKIKELILGILEDFAALEPRQGSLVMYKAVVLFFPDVSSFEAPAIVDRVQRECQPLFVAKGLMLGEFHSLNNSEGIRNKSYFPLRTAVPCLAVRIMVPSDVAFLSKPKLPASSRRRFLAGFIEHFDKGTSNSEEIARAHQALAQAFLDEEEAAATTTADAQPCDPRFATSEACTKKLPGTEESGGGGVAHSLAAALEADSPEAFRRNGHALVDWVASYRERCSELPVRSMVSPGYLQELLPAEAPEVGEPWEAIMRDVDRAILPGLTHCESGRFFAYFKAHAAYASVLGELLAAGLNVMGFNWIASPACTELEILTLNWLGKALGLPEEFLLRDQHRPAAATSATSSGGAFGGGVIQGSSGEAVIVVMLAAQSRALKQAAAAAAAASGGGEDPEAEGFVETEEWRKKTISRFVVYVSDQAHAIVQKGCVVLGIPMCRLRVLPTELADAYSLRPEVLSGAMKADIVAGLLPLMVVPTVGSRSTTALDPIGLLADAARSAAASAGSAIQPWVHVDAAYGGSYAVCEEFRYIFEGIERADSLAVNAHKKLLVNFDCCALWVKDRRPLLESLSLGGLTPEALRNPATGTGSCVDYKDWQLPLGRRFRALKLWCVMRSLGTQGLQAHLRNGVRLAIAFEAKVRAHPDFEVYVERKMALVCFRLRPPRLVGSGGSEQERANELNQALQDRLDARGKVFLIHAKVSGSIVLRMAIGGLDHTDEDIAKAWEEIRIQGESIIAAAQRSIEKEEASITTWSIFQMIFGRALRSVLMDWSQ